MALGRGCHRRRRTETRGAPSPPLAAIFHAEDDGGPGVPFPTSDVLGVDGGGGTAATPDGVSADCLGGFRKFREAERKNGRKRRGGGGREERG